ncbi:hypothetical protein FA132_22845 [Pseudomonas aeruginosa]|nr:hypothetical protein [Pseudomonas aeruginosa]
MRLSSLSAAILAVTVSLGASASVICEFERTNDLSGCNKCFKSNEDGVQLFIGGRLRASSTSLAIFPSQPIDGLIYQRGIEKKDISGKADAKMFEVCYQAAPVMKAVSFTFRMTDPELEEIEMGNPAPGAARPYTFVVKSQPRAGEAAFFGSRLVFMAKPGWKGRAQVKYAIVDPDGVESTPAVITLMSGQAIQEESGALASSDGPTAGATEADAELQGLLAELEGAEAALAQEHASGELVRSQITALEAQLAGLYRLLEERERQIAALQFDEQYRANKRAQELASKALLESLPMGDYFSYSVLQALSGPFLPSSLAQGRRAPVRREKPQMRFILPRRLPSPSDFGSLSYVDGPEDGVISNPRISVSQRHEAAPVAAVETGRLSKKAKKRLKKDRRKSTTYGKRRGRFIIETPSPMNLSAVSC